MHIAFFDSGLGGLSIVQAFFAHPQAALVNIRRCSYIADTGAFPYGDKNDNWLIERVVKIMRASLEQLKPDLIVVACNTASTLALATLRCEFNIPFIGVVPAIKPAIEASKSGVIGVLATPATVARNYTSQLINDYAPKQHVLLHGCSHLVTQAERRILGLPVDTYTIRLSLKGLLEQNGSDKIDTIVLACTHFPLLKEVLQQEYTQLCPNNVTWIDSGEAIARRIIQLAPSVHAAYSTQSETAKSTVDAPKTAGAKANILSLQLVTTGGPLAAQYAKQFNQALPAGNKPLLDEYFGHYIFDHLNLII